jgi:hypothetical protein
MQTTAHASLVMFPLPLAAIPFLTLLCEEQKRQNALVRYWQIALAFLAFSVSLALAEDFKTLNGKEYKNASVSRVEPDGITIKFSGGIVKIPFIELKADVQKKYGYDSSASAAYSEQEFERQAAIAQQMKTDEQRRAEEQRSFEERRKAGGDNPTSEQVQAEPKSGASSQDSSTVTQGPCPIPNATFLGRVVSVVNSGEAVLTIQPSQYFGLSPTPGTAVYVYAQFGNVVDGDWFKFVGACVGRVQYHTAAGAMATVWGYRGRVIPTPEGRTY